MPVFDCGMAMPHVLAGAIRSWVTARHRPDDHFQVVVPTGRVISPITKTDWAGTGVEPDVKVAADEALDVAKRLAAEAIGKKMSTSN